MKRFNLNIDKLISFCQFMYILSLYLLTYREGLNTISNILALIYAATIWMKIILSGKKLIFNGLLALQLIFNIICLASIFVSINQSTVMVKVRTLFLIFAVMFTLINYIDSYDKIRSILKHFVYSGFIASIYIIANSDFSVLTRYGKELGNQNAVGMIIGISSVFCFYIILQEKRYWYALFLTSMIPCILLTGSRKSLLFVVINTIIIFYFKNRNSLKTMVKFFILTICTLLVFYYLVFNIPIFYEIIGDRMENFFTFLKGEKTNEASINVRASMIIAGYEFFKNRPFTGYGIDNYRYLYAGTYSHNNFIELMVGTGIVGFFVFYLMHAVAIRKLYKISKLTEYSLLCYTIIAIIISYIVLSATLVYYSSKHFNIIMALASVISILANHPKVIADPAVECGRNDVK